MAVIDWVVVAAFISAVTFVGLWFTRRASKSMEEYFVAGRTIPWWLAGTSMLATSFASDTPLHTTRAIREGGLAAAWFYWNLIIAGLIVAFVFSKLWRRAGVTTDNELSELRYAGKRAAVLRGGMAVFKCFFLELLTMAWITLGMTKIVKTIMDLPDRVAIFGLPPVTTEVLVVAALLALTLLFSMASGFWGVVSTDVMEFAVAMTGAVILAIVAMQKVGGIVGLRDGLRAVAPQGEATLDLTPRLFGEGASMLVFGVYIGVQWWATAQIDGTGQRAQRFLACKDDQNAVAAGVWNMAVQYLIRSWPWYLTALVSLVLYPHLTDHETAYPLMVKELMPVGLKGLMVASFFAAFMGTMEAHYNLTASYATNDVYKRFVRPGRSEVHYVRASRWMTLVVASVAAVAALLLPSVLGAFRFKMELVAGLGLIYVLRWMWWRINASSEMAALLSSVVAALGFNALPLTAGGGAEGSALRLLLVVTVSAACAIAVTFLTAPEPTPTLIAFYRRVRPPRLLWGPIAAQAGELGPSDFGWRTVAQIALSTVFVYSGMIGVGKLVLGAPVVGGGLVALSVVTGWLTLRWVFGAKPAARALPLEHPT
jgi:solute:Na+ symporter, SSS family